MSTSLSRAVDRAFQGSPVRRTWAALLLVPLLIAGLLTWAFWSPLSDHGAARAAVVNLDEPVQVGGQTVPLGRQLADNLVHGQDRRYEWTLTDGDDARQGLKDGRYAAAVTVPGTFSARATSSATGKPLEAAQATLRIETSPGAALADPAISKDVADAAVDALNTQVVETYLDNVYGGFTTLHEQLGKAAEGADSLAEGTGDLATGTRRLSGGTRDLTAGLGELRTGSAELAQGTGRLTQGTTQLAISAKQLATGATQLATGTKRLASGSRQLSRGLSEAARDTKQLPALTRELADGARQVATGNRQLADTVTSAADQVTAAIDDVPSASAATGELARLASRCRDGDAGQGFCDSLSDAAGRLESIAGDIDGMKARARSGVGEIKQSLDTLATGAEQVADGTAQLATRSKTLASGISSAATAAGKLTTGLATVNTGAGKLSTGAGRLAQGAQSLASGATRLNTGAQQVAAGTAQAYAGADDLASGAKRLSTGAARAGDGASTLAKGLSDGLDDVPAYTTAEREHLSKVAATPVLAPAVGDGAHRDVAATFFLVLALWAGALATYLVIRAVPPFALTSRLPTWRLVGQALVPGTVIALFTGTLLGLGLPALLDLGLGARVAFLGATLLAALTFMTLCQGLAGLLRRTGHLAVLAVLVLTVATSTVSSIPAPLAALESLLPTHAALTVLRAAATGADLGWPAAAAQLAGWLLAGLAMTAFTTERRRSLNPRDLRLNRQDLQPVG
ncbi:YhgE/Pip domain-containing protein [Nonomuraea monospora]|uniref:YhgE/Pip domain-containing protein n=1 Tax=Nonomuraea monospora TaxID=568818 RepID=A0ABN3CD46_9ACTN